MRQSFRKFVSLHLLIYLFTSGFPFQLHAQTESVEVTVANARLLSDSGEPDSAISLLKKKSRMRNVNPSELAQVYHELFELYHRYPEVANKDSAIYYLEKDISLQASDSMLHYRNMQLGYQYAFYGDFLNSEIGYQKALDYLKGVQTLEDSVNNYKHLGQVKAKNGKFEEGLKIIEEGIRIAYRSDNLEAQHLALSGKSMFYFFSGKYDNHKSQVLKLLDLSKALGDSAKINNALSTLSNLSNMSHKPDSAEYYFWEAKKYQTKKSPILELGDKVSLATIYLLSGKLDQSEKVLEEIFEGYRQFDMDRTEKAIVPNTIMGRVKMGQKDYQSAAFYYEEALSIAKETNNLKRQKTSYNELIKALKAEGNYQRALQIKEEENAISDSLYKDFYEGKLAETEAKIGLTVKEKDLEKAQIELERKQAQQTLFIGSIAILILVLLGGGWAYRRINRDKKLIEQQKGITEQALHEKELLLKEIHHRVKNNLQIISSMLSKQARMSEDEAFKESMKEGQNRVKSMALVHQNLYQGQDLSAIEIKKYIEELTRNIAASHHPADKELDLDLQVEDIKFDIDTVIPLGLILNELLTNIYKYAFETRDSGKIIIELTRKAKEKFLLKVGDNGVGMGSDVNIRRSRSLGLSLVNGLVRQLKGEIDVKSSAQGTEFEIVF